MKVCRKCNNEYKEAYSFCPKCGTPHDPKMKYAKIPGEISHESKETAVKVWNIILYVFGSLLICAYLLSFKEDIKSSIFAILFGLSLFQIFYKLLEDNLNINKSFLKVLRIILPIVIMITWGICCPVDNTNTDFDSSTSMEQKENVKKKDEDKNTTQTPEVKPEEKEETTTEPKEEQPPVVEETKKTIISINYNELGEYGKMQEYEGADDYFYHIPNGTYKVTRKSGKDSVCFLWVFYKKSYQDTWGTEYNSKEKFTYKSNGQSETITITDDVMLYNSNNCNYELEQK